MTSVNAEFTATAIPSSVPGPTHTFSLFFFTQISYHTPFPFAELKPHSNSLHSLTYKLDALQQAVSICGLCMSGSAFLQTSVEHCYWVQYPCVYVYSRQLAPACGSRMAGSHHLERGCNYHLQGLKAGEGHGRPEVQSLLYKCHWLTVQLGKITMPCSVSVSSSLKSEG